MDAAKRHALRVSELVDIRWPQVHLDTATIDIRRAKNGTPGIHRLQGDSAALRCCREWLPRGSKPPSCRQRPDAQSPALPLYQHVADAILSKSIRPDGEHDLGVVYDLFYQDVPGVVVWQGNKIAVYAIG